MDGRAVRDGGPGVGGQGGLVGLEGKEGLAVNQVLREQLLCPFKERSYR